MDDQFNTIKKNFLLMVEEMLEEVFSENMVGIDFCSLKEQSIVTDLFRFTEEPGLFLILPSFTDGSQDR